MRIPSLRFRSIVSPSCGLVLQGGLCAGLLAALFVGVLAAGPAHAAQPAAADDEKPLGSEPSPFLKHVRPKAWTMRYAISLQLSADCRDCVTRQYEVSAASINVPIVLESGSAVIAKRETEDGAIEPILNNWELEFDDRQIQAEVEFFNKNEAKATQATTTSFAVDSVGTQTVRVGEIELKVEFDATCHRVQFNERRANNVEWPTGRWPERARVWLEQQAFVEQAPGRSLGDGPVDAFIAEATGGRDPKDVKPVPLAKWVAGKLAEQIQPSGQGARGSDRAQGLGFRGLQVQGAAETIRSGKGSETDMAAALVAVYRKLGIPARLVIGFDVAESKGRRDASLGESSSTVASAIRPYVEFALYDEETDSLGWVPVDIVAMRKRSSRMPPSFMSRPQKYFGTHDELDQIVPLSYELATFDVPGSVTTTEPTFWTFTLAPRIPTFFEPTVMIEANTKVRRGR